MLKCVPKGLLAVVLLSVGAPACDDDITPIRRSPRSVTVVVGWNFEEVTFSDDYVLVQAGDTIYWRFETDGARLVIDLEEKAPVMPRLLEIPPGETRGVLVQPVPGSPEVVPFEILGVIYRYKYDVTVTIGEDPPIIVDPYIDVEPG